MNPKNLKLFLIILSVVLILGALAFILHQQLISVSFLKDQIRKQTAKASPDFVLRDLTAQKIKLDWLKGEWIIQQPTIKFKYKGDSYFISMGEMHVLGLKELFNPNKQIPIQLKHVAIVSDLLNVSDMDVDGKCFWASREWNQCHAHLNMAAVDLDLYHLSQVEADLIIDKERFALNKVKALFYDGQLSADVMSTIGDKVGYSINAILKGVNLGQLSSADEAIFSQMKGLMDGQVQVTLSDGHLNALRLRLTVPQGGAIKKQLVLFPLDLVADGSLDSVKQVFTNNELLRKTDVLDYNLAQVEGLSLNGLQFRSKIKLFSKPWHIDLNYTIDVNIEEHLFMSANKFVEMLQSVRQYLNSNVKP